MNSTSAGAQEFRPPRTAALGGAGRAGPLMNDGVYLNPSFLAFLKSYTFAAHYEWDRGETRGRIINLAVQDGSSEFFSAGFGYTVRNDAKFLNLALARAILPKVSVGLGGKMRLGTGGDPNLIDGSVSATYIVSPLLQLAFVADNVLETERKRERGLNRQFTVGTRFSIENIWIIYADPHFTPNVDNQFGLDVGMEFRMFPDLTFKIGHFRESQLPHLNQRGKGYSVGAGWVGPRLSLDLAIVRTLEPIATSSTVAGFTVFF